jgi:Protein of unknown function (DUF2510)
MAQPLPIAGWYPDPETDGQDRWWDGATWSDTRRASSDAAPQPARPVGVAAAWPQASRGPGLYVPGETVLQPAPAYAAAPVVRNNMAVLGFFLALSGFVFPLVINSFAGAIISIIGLRRSKHLAGTGVFSNGRGISIAGILIGFIWGGLSLIFVVAMILFEVWIYDVTTNLPPVI